MYKGIIGIIVIFLLALARVIPTQCSKAKEAQAVEYNKSGIAKYKLQNYLGSILDFNKAIEFNPKYALAYYNRGIANYKLQYYQEACLDWSKADKLGHGEATYMIHKHCN